jgi:hypothetical protein
MLYTVVYVEYHLSFACLTKRTAVNASSGSKQPTLTSSLRYMVRKLQHLQKEVKKARKKDKKRKRRRFQLLHQEIQMLKSIKLSAAERR